MRYRPAGTAAAWRARSPAPVCTCVRELVWPLNVRARVCCVFSLWIRGRRNKKTTAPNGRVTPCATNQTKVRTLARARARAHLERLDRGVAHELVQEGALLSPAPREALPEAGRVWNARLERHEPHREREKKKAFLVAMRLATSIPEAC